MIHLAATVGVRHILTNLLSAIHTNVAGADVVLRLVAANRRRVLLASTSEVYSLNKRRSPVFPTQPAVVNLEWKTVAGFFKMSATNS